MLAYVCVLHFPSTLRREVGVRDFPLRDLISLSARRMGLGYSEEILPSSPSSAPSSPTRGWGGAIGPYCNRSGLAATGRTLLQPVRPGRALRQPGGQRKTQRKLETGRRDGTEPSWNAAATGCRRARLFIKAVGLAESQASSVERNKPNKPN